MKTIRETYKGILFCLLISVPAYLLGKQFEVIGGPVFAILIGMCLALIVKQTDSLQAGIQFTSKKILQYAVHSAWIWNESDRYSGKRMPVPSDYSGDHLHIPDHCLCTAQGHADPVQNLHSGGCRLQHLRRLCHCGDGAGH